MLVTDYDGNPIRSLEDWRKSFFEYQKKQHWREGRSAYEIANFIMHENGSDKIKQLISKMLNKTVTLDKGIPEWEVRFDEFGHGREHDFAIWGKAEESSIFIGVESKVDEPFGSTIADRYLIAKTEELNGVSTKAPRRVEELMKRNFGKVKLSHFSLRYQLLYATTGTVAEKADISILLILVFKTSDYVKSIGESNFKDYMKFLKAIEAETVLEEPDVKAHKIDIEKKALYSIYAEIDKNCK